MVVPPSCPGLHVIFYRLKKTSLFDTDLCLNHTIIIVICFFKNKNENNDIKTITPSNIPNQIFCTTVFVAFYMFQIKPSVNQSINQSVDISIAILIYIGLVGNSEKNTAQQRH